MVARDLQNKLLQYHVISLDFTLYRFLEPRTCNYEGCLVRIVFLQTIWFIFLLMFRLAQYTFSIKPFTKKKEVARG